MQHITGHNSSHVIWSLITFSKYGTNISFFFYSKQQQKWLVIHLCVDNNLINSLAYVSTGTKISEATAEQM